MRLRMPRKRAVQITFSIRGYHAVVGELLTYKREAKNAIVMYCGTIKTEDLSETEWKVATVCHESPAGIDSEKRLSNTK